MPDRNGVELASRNAKDYDITPQAEGEPNEAFRSRVAGALRSQMKFIEAHESYNNRYHDEPDETGECPTGTGILGAVALTMAKDNPLGKESDEERNIGHDIAAGYVKHKPPREQDDARLTLLMAMLGGMR